MPYHNFTLKNVKSRLGIVTEITGKHYNFAPLIQPSETLVEILQVDEDMIYIASEMARRENFISPILKEAIRHTNRKAVLYSQIEFNADPSLHLTGEVDYIITAPPMRFEIDHPIIGIAEAKVTNLSSGFGQCIAEMLASRIHNERVHHIHLPQIYGVVTDGLQWQFMELVGNVARIESQAIAITELSRILGILVWMIETQLKHIEEATPKTN